MIQPPARPAAQSRPGKPHCSAAALHCTAEMILVLVFLLAAAAGEERSGRAGGDRGDTHVWLQVSIIKCIKITKSQQINIIILILPSDVRRSYYLQIPVTCKAKMCRKKYMSVQELRSTSKLFRSFKIKVKEKT